MFPCLILIFNQAFAVPLQLTQQGRLLDPNGASITGTHVLHFRIYDDISSGLLLYEESLNVVFNNGYYSSILGTDEVNNPLDQSVLSLYPLYLELEVNNNGPLSPRQPILSTPYAQLSRTSTNLEGGTVNSTEISIGGNIIIDSNGSWVGPTINVAWNDVTGTPSDILDGDNDTQLSETQVEGFVTNSAIDLAYNSMVNGDGIVTYGTDSDTLLDISCTDGDIPKFDALTGWYCDIDTDSLANLNCSNGETIAYDANTNQWNCAIIADTLDALSCANGQTVVYDTNSAEWTCAILADTLANTNCADGEILSYDQTAGNWVCTSFNAIIDQDSDGVLAWNDCDDNDPNVLSNVSDQDCDGYSISEDCDDNDPSSETIFTDADCDGFLTNSDCDDTNPNVSIGDGSSMSCAGTTCLGLLVNGQTASGAYYLDPNGTGAFEAFCDMTTENGGWTLVANLNFSDTNNNGWGSTQSGTAGLNDRYILNFDVLPDPSEMMMRYEPSGSYFIVDFDASSGWQVDNNQQRHLMNDGNYLTLTDGFHGTDPDIYCVVNGSYGYNCDGDMGQVAGRGMFNTSAQNELGNCSGSAWKVNLGGNTATECNPTGYASLWFRE